MNTNQKELWNRIKEFQFNEPGIAFTFTDRLARENNWPKEFAKQAVEEYRKFLYLCCVADHQITPSDEVDQVWHLHLTYTRSYWKELCEKTLGRELHHNPTKGGKDEALKFDDCYSRSFRLYEEHFAQQPPASIWPSNEKRFGRTETVRVDKLRFWLIPKPRLRTRIALTVTALALLGLFNIAALKSSDWIGAIAGILVVLVAIFLVTIAGRKRNGNKNDSGDSGCSMHSDSSSGHHGCSGDGGCSSGCGGGGCGGD